MDAVKKARGVTQDTDLTADDLKQLAEQFKQIVKERLGRVIRDFCDQLRRCLLHVELFTPCHQTQDVVEGVQALSAGPTIKIRPLHLHRPHHGFDRAADSLSGLQHPITLRTGALLTVVCTTVDMCHNRLGEAPGELLA
jgi:pyruvate-formate lyase-activating enzyme